MEDINCFKIMTILVRKMEDGQLDGKDIMEIHIGKVIIKTVLELVQF